MGVNLRDIANPRKITIEELNGKSLAIDAFNALYQFLSTIRGMTGELLRDNKGHVTSHLSGLFYRNMNLLETGVKLLVRVRWHAAEPEKRGNKTEKTSQSSRSSKYNEALEKKDYVAAKKVRFCNGLP